MSPAALTIAGAAILIGGGILAALLVMSARSAAARQVGEAREEAEAVLADARRRAEARAQEILLEAREKAESDVARASQQAAEKIARADEALARTEAREAEAARREADAAAAHEEAQASRTEAAAQEGRAREAAAAAESARAEQALRLERIAEMSAEEARRELLERIESESRQDAARLVSKVQTLARQEAVEVSRRTLYSALHRLPGRDVLDPIVTMVRLPGDEMKGRIIGKEGRNIRTLELATGVDVIIDNTPGVILLSAYDPLRREIARVALEKLIEDGRIHPARIEEVVERSRLEIEGLVQEAGETAAFEMGLTDIHKRLLHLLGALKFRTLRGYNLLLQSRETALIAGFLAAEAGARERIARRAGLLHLVAWGEDEARPGPGMAASAEIAGKFGEPPEVVEAIGSLSPGVEARTAEALLLQVARRVTEARPGARKDNLASYIERLHHLEEIAASYPGVRRAYAVKGGRELRVLVESARMSDEEAVLLSRRLARRIESEASFNGEIKVSVIRETRSVDYAV